MKMEIIKPSTTYELIDGKIVDIDEVEDRCGHDVLVITVERTVKKKKIQFSLVISDPHFLDDCDLDDLPIKARAQIGWVSEDEQNEIKEFIRLSEKYKDAEDFLDGGREPDDR